MRKFTQQAWPILEPARPFVDNWHIGAICEHLEAVTFGQIRRLLMNVPPGMMKSLSTMVFWPAWEWGPRNLPHIRNIGASYSSHLSIRDTTRTRMLIGSPWFQERWGDQFRIKKDTESYFTNDKTGFRLATSVGGVGTGERGDRFTIDDPHNVKEGESDAVREDTIKWFLETVPTRLTEPSESAIICIMQRIHTRDVSGIILSEGLPYEHLILPMEFEGKTCVTVLGVQDPRKEEGELIFPKRFPRSSVEELKQTLKEYGTAGQLQQRPAPRGGGVIKRGWFEIVRAAPASLRKVRAWDLAGTTKTKTNNPDWTVGVLMSKAPNGIYYIENVVRDQLSPLGVESLILNTASQDGRMVPLTLPQDPGQAGKSQAQQMVLKLSTYIAKIVIPTGDKWTRAQAFAAQVEAGNVKLVEGPWNEAFLTELAAFPTGSHDDQLDAASDAFNELVLGNTFDAETFKKANQ